jgi:hypothetical protein
VARLLARVLVWIEPEDNPSAVVYGTIAVGLLIAAEEPAVVTYPRVVVASALAVVLYWLAHAYATLLGSRLVDPRPPTAQQVAAALRLEWAVVKGAAAPLVALLVAWVAGVSLAAAVWAALWVCVGALVAFEVIAGVRARLPGGQVAGSAALGATIGAGLLLLKALLH